MMYSCLTCELVFTYTRIYLGVHLLLMYVGGCSMRFSCALFILLLRCILGG